ncbi:MAG: LysM domain-containing protein [Chloroflexota bacterium]
MKRVAFALFCLLLAGTALAQDQVTPEVPFSTPAPLVRVTPDANDARGAACSAAAMPDFVPYVVRPGDQLADLLVTSSAFTVTQLAALNCIDDPAALPVGAVLWLPAAPDAEALDVTEAASDAALTLEAASETTAEATQAAPSALIQSFNADTDTLLNTDSVTLSWLATGDAAYFYLCPLAECARPSYAQPLPLAGSVTFAGFQSAGEYTYRLDVAGAGGPITRDVRLTVTCAQEWLGGIGASPRCPSDPAINVYAVWQPFEHGVMLWFSDTAQIYVMTDDGQLSVYADQFVEGQPDPAEQAPSGLLTPVRGFGQVWLALGGAESALGWATTSEVGYDGARQAAGRTSYTTYIQGPGSTVYAVTQIPGAETGWWAQVAW